MLTFGSPSEILAQVDAKICFFSIASAALLASEQARVSCNTASHLGQITLHDRHCFAISVARQAISAGTFGVSMPYAMFVPLLHTLTPRDFHLHYVLPRWTATPCDVCTPHTIICMLVYIISKIRVRVTHGQGTMLCNKEPSPTQMKYYCGKRYERRGVVTHRCMGCVKEQNISCNPAGSMDRPCCLVLEVTRGGAHSREYGQ